MAKLGHVGLAQPSSPILINSLLENGYLPVVSSIGVTDERTDERQCRSGGNGAGGNAGRGSDFALRRQRHSRRQGQRIAEMTAAKAEQLIEQGIITDGMME